MESNIHRLYGRNFVNSEDAVSEIMGNMLILSIILVSVSVVMIYGIPSINNLKEDANVKNIEQSFTVMSPLVDDATIGDAPTHTILMDLGGGSLSVIPNGTSNNNDNINRESYISIRDENSSFNIVEPMGKVVYHLGDRVVAYEGGGIWSQYPSGSVMVSPPEFHYNGETLTLPVINIGGSGYVGGKGITKTIFNKNAMTPTLLFPTGYNNKTNPLDFNKTGKIYVNITSDYYDAWADYAEGLLFTNVSKYPDIRTTSIELTVVPNNLGSNVPLQNPIKMRGIPKKKYPLKNFSMMLYGDMNNFNWDFRAVKGNRELIFYIKQGAGNTAELNIGYIDGRSSDGETWGQAIYNIVPDPNNRGYGYINVDLLDNNTNITYSNQQVGSSNAQACQPLGDKINGIADPDYSWDDIVLHPGDGLHIYDVTQHYISELTKDGGANFYWCSPSNGRGRGHQPDTPSSMILNYDAIGEVTFLYVSDNEVNVTIE